MRNKGKKPSPYELVIAFLTGATPQEAVKRGYPIKTAYRYHVHTKKALERFKTTWMKL